MTWSTFLFSFIDGLSLLNENGGLRVFFTSNSFVTNDTLTHTDVSPPIGVTDHIVCYGGHPQAAQVTWNSTSRPLQECSFEDAPIDCYSCGPVCVNNGGVGLDLPDNGYTSIHMFTNISGYVNQDLECRVCGYQSAFIGVYLKEGGRYNMVCCNSCIYVDP